MWRKNMPITPKDIESILSPLLGQPITPHIKNVVLKKLHKKLWPKCVVIDDTTPDMELANVMQAQLVDQHQVSRFGFYRTISPNAFVFWVD
jgi:hypothetical protein